ncbi:phytanoyl-CoA dioxygenase family protein [Roseofilum sp. BLCC_M154]|uniref:Phytanoyl-CoA dioxygenase family protein n=1 Tax=Roseofilum acuticapitatum BLCC-M154 TaxID=3022444 RepID=A0ABT7B0B1_9CYAN|nr:phytanoyl-CoA dioxygenase family protein [Roseofilum acuticapitatum]MDJ1172252.1 phytanoyl-CoA dioxygenase family protein [Roseofilum acuticapitatum BLCC-M154]
MVGISDLYTQVQNPDFWKQLNPGLSIEEYSSNQPIKAIAFNPEALEEQLLYLQQEGYFQLDPVLPEIEVFRMAAGIELLALEGWPAVFAFVYDEFWLILHRISNLIAAILGENYRQLPAFWEWYVGTDNDQSGWSPHRDRGGNTLRPDRLPNVITIWIPFTDAIPLNGCMYVLPPDRDPYYSIYDNRPEDPFINPQDIRALPAAAGSILGWNHRIMHWGGRSSSIAPHPRISLSCEFQRGDVEPYDPPLLDPLTVPSFQQRLALIGKQIMRYQHMYDLPPELVEVARQIIDCKL